MVQRRGSLWDLETGTSEVVRPRIGGLARAWASTGEGAGGARSVCFWAGREGA